MNGRRLVEIIEEGESSTLEFKRKTVSPEKLAREICAIANTKGGMLMIGVDDDGTVVGVQSEKSEAEWAVQACEFCIDPPVEYKLEIVGRLGMDVIVVHIPESKIKPHKITVTDKETGKPVKRAYIRMGEKSIMASKEMCNLMSDITFGQPLKLSIGENEKRLFDYLEKHEKATVKDFAALVNISSRRAERLLIRLVRAGVLLIHNNEVRDYFTLV